MNRLPRPRTTQRLFSSRFGWRVDDDPLFHPGGQQPEREPGAQTLTRIDAHCHSKASDGPAMAALGFIGCPESFSEPEKVYDQAKARGMDLVTLTDHDTIAGAMRLVERGFQDFIVGQEVTVYFPEDRCKLHVLVWGLDPALDEEITKERLRDDVYRFAAWLRERNLPHAFAHPLYIQNGKLTLWHLERAALLFKGFEVLNGAHSVDHKRALDRFLDRLTPGRLLRLADKHGIEPIWPRAWEKARTGGSDDHALLNVGKTWTQVACPEGRKIADPAEFFRRVMGGKSDAGGDGGHAALLAHQLNAVGVTYLANRFEGKGRPRTRYARSKLLRFVGYDERPPGKGSLVADTLRRKVIQRKKRNNPLLTALRETLPDLLERHPEIKSKLDPERWADGSAFSEHDRMEAFSAELVRDISAILQDRGLQSLGKKDGRAFAEHLAAYALLQAAQLPYIFSLFHQNKERWLVDRIEHRLADPGSGVSAAERPIKVMLFTDTLGDVNGVTRFIRTMGEKAHEHGRELTIVTSTNIPCPDRPWIRNFKPLFSHKMPGYDQLELALPPLMEMLRFVDRNRPDVIHISTPGSVGLVGLIAAKMAKVPVVGVYHTDFPAFVDRIFEDHVMTSVAEVSMRKFYGRFAGVLTRSKDYLPKLEALGLSAQRCSALTPGCDTKLFTPMQRDPSVWEGTGVRPAAVKVLYCGRVSVEKNTPLLVKAWKRAKKELDARGVDAQLVVVGDGPAREQMERELKRDDAIFLGFRHGEELSKLYASADLFVFPSETDTLGQVVMEAQASGLPAIVSDIGGPSEIVQDGLSGIVVPTDRADLWVRAIVDLCADSERRRAMGETGHAAMQAMSVDAMFESFWSTHEAAWRERLEQEGLTPQTAGVDGRDRPGARSPAAAAT
ncbi:MAG: glycosyltransferase [Phycisphaerales bacterium]|nr:MAG: glycosyltransferase [Phycisphaerales bacterium]